GPMHCNRPPGGSACASRPTRCGRNRPSRGAARPTPGAATTCIRPCPALRARAGTRRGCRATGCAPNWPAPGAAPARAAARRAAGLALPLRAQQPPAQAGDGDVGLVEASIARDAPRLDALAQALWERPELGYLETASSGELQQALREAGFEVSAGVADMPTAFV